MPSLDIRREDPRTPAARSALRQYQQEVQAAAGLQELDLTAALGDVDGFLGARGVFLIASVGDAAVGCVGLRPLSAADGEIKRMWVSPARRGSGLAADLLAAVEEQAHGLGYTRLLLDTHGALGAALRFYSTHGYRQIQRYNDNPDATHFFAKDLPGG